MTARHLAVFVFVLLQISFDALQFACFCCIIVKKVFILHRASPPIAVGGVIFLSINNDSNYIIN
jgi:hypothetical protein